MKQTRLLILNLYLPLGLSLYNGVGRALPTTTIHSLKTFLIYVSCSLPVFLSAHLASKAALAPCKKIHLGRQAALVFGSLFAVLFAYFYLWGYSIVVWNWFPWLKSGFSYEFSPSIGGFWTYLRSSTGLLLIPVWFFANLIYEYASADFCYFSGRTSANETPTQGTAQATSDGSSPQTGFLSKISPSMGHSMIALEAQQHYVLVHTESGSDLVLYRFGDAVKELEAAGLGVQVHRSFAVAPHAVVQAKRIGRSQVLLMSNGLKVPVSQSYKSVLDRLLADLSQNNAAAQEASPAN